MTDSRVEKIFRLGFLHDWAERSVKAFEAAGLVVIDPDDEGMRTRVQAAVCELVKVPDCNCEAITRATLAALRAGA
jgi:uncharacterized protein YllA (UPF0747 family)